MDFYEVVDQVVKLLQQRGRLTYRSLKVQFQLDDATCEALKDELLFSHPVVDHESRGVVWIGASEAKPAPVSAFPSAQTSQLPTAEEEPHTQIESLSTEHRLPEAERRQLTVMFCDLVDSTKLSSQLDPEEYRNIVRTYQKVCTEVIQRYEGHIAQLLGDGLLIYFGYPQAHEDDAQRAVRTGLGILAAMEDQHTRLQREKGLQLSVRLGIHTGLVVVGALGEAGRQEQLALGETPNIAARIQGLAAPNTLVVSSATYHLIQGYFACQELGVQTLRGVAEPIAVYRVLSESGATSRLDVAQPRGLTPLVGREQEVALLAGRWEQVKAGHGHVVLLTGDAGIGKSRLVQVLKDHIATEPHVRWECRSAEYYENTTLFPLVELFQRLLQFHAEDTLDEKLGKLEQTLRQYRLPLEETIPLFAPLLSLPLSEDRYPPLALSPQRQRQKTLETIITILLELAEHQPVLFILEDLHWTDPTTLELLNLLIDQTPTASILVLMTCRPHFQPHWSRKSYLSEVTVHRLSPTQVAQIVNRMTDGKTFPAEVLQQILTKTDGVPLFVEELTKAILESGHLKDVNGHYELVGSFSTFAIPSTLQDSLMARLDRLVTAKGIAQLAAVIGRQFSFELLQAISQLDAMMLQRELGRLVEAELVYQRGLPPQTTYTFKHALIQDAAYESLLKSTRQHYHQRIAQVLEAQFPETAETQPELLAQHYTEANLTEKGVHYWYTAGQKASERSAHAEAISHLRQGLAFLEMLPETSERVQREVDLLIALGASLLAIKGYAASEMEQTYTRARHLCEQLENPRQLFIVLRGLWNYYQGRAEFQMAHTLSKQLLALAQQVQDTAMLLAAHRTLGATLYHVGAVASAHTHFAQGIALYDLQQHRASTFLHGEDAGVVCRILDASSLWCLGYPDQGLRQSQAAIALAQHIGHPFSLGFAWSNTAIFHQLRREVRAAQACADAVISLATEQRFPQWKALGSLLYGWARVQQGQAEEGSAQISQSLTAWRATGAEIGRPYSLALLAEAHGTIGEPETGLTVLTDALTLVDTTGARWYESECYRLKGELLLQQSSDNQAEAETCFTQAISIAQNQSAKSWELRAATSLAKLWQQQGKRQEAYDLLAPVYHWFTEGFDTADLKDAKALLDALGEQRHDV
jgi:class 3 adenylate cyclase/predicted ATPase